MPTKPVLSCICLPMITSLFSLDAGPHQGKHARLLLPVAGEKLQSSCHKVGQSMQQRVDHIHEWVGTSGAHPRLCATVTSCPKF